MSRYNWHGVINRQKTKPPRLNMVYDIQKLSDKQMTQNRSYLAPINEKLYMTFHDYRMFCPYQQPYMAR